MFVYNIICKTPSEPSVSSFSTLRVRAGVARTITIENYVSEQHKLPHSRSIMLINMKEVECDDEAPSANEGG